MRRMSLAWVHRWVHRFGALPGPLVRRRKGAFRPTALQSSAPTHRGAVSGAGAATELGLLAPERIREE